MIITKAYIQPDDGRLITRTWSDKGVYIRGGYPEANYVEAIDPTSANRSYVETDIPIEETEATAEEALDILLGRTP
jgi:hypothetical protein